VVGEQKATAQGDKPSAAGTVASIALLVFVGLNAWSLASWFGTGSPLLHWKPLLTLVCVVLCLGLSAALWRNPTRALASVGLFLMLLSLFRVGLPTQWNGFSFALLSITLILAMPLVNAIFSLKN
jgi:hypothetical protein